MIGSKEELLKTIETLPEEFILNAYSLDFVTRQIQMRYNSELVRRFGKEGKISNNGYFEFILELEDGYQFGICMT
jgi:hypothetical protein